MAHADEVAEWQELIERGCSALLHSFEGLPDAALEWQPLPSETSSISALVYHSMAALKWWFVEGLTGEPVPQDRTADFAPRRVDAATLAAHIATTAAECKRAVAAVAPGLFDVVRPITLNHTLEGTLHTPRFGLIWALRHLWEHIGHAGLTRQLWEA